MATNSVKVHCWQRGLYLLTDEQPFDQLLPKLEAALPAGLALLQYRRKTISKADQIHELAQLIPICQRYQTPLMLNDDWQQAAELGCGVHLGQQDGDIATARRALGSHAIIGRTCHDRLELAAEALAEGADYVAFGAVYPSQTKPQATAVSIHTLKQAVDQSVQPVCAIGGLNLDNVHPVLEAGVRLIAVSHDLCVLPAAQISHRMQQWQRLLAQYV